MGLNNDILYMGGSNKSKENKKHIHKLIRLDFDNSALIFI